MRTLLVPLAAATLLTAACASDSGILGGDASATEVAVDPASCLGDVSCSGNPGGLASFVVTLRAFDDANDTTPFMLPSSLATPCSLLAGQQALVVAGALYVAEIDGYDFAASSLTPFGGPSSGSRQMLGADGKLLPARWKTACGTGPATATKAVAHERVFVGHCGALTDSSPTATTLRLSPEALLGADPCAVASTMTIASVVGEFPDLLELACAAAPLEVPATPHANYRLHVTATDADGTELGTECTALTHLGEAVTPTCDALSPHGRVRFDLRELETDGGEARCPSGHYFKLVGAEDAADAPPVPCESVAIEAPIAPGIRTFSVLMYDGLGQPTGASATCAADVEPGLLVDALCL